MDPKGDHPRGVTDFGAFGTDAIEHVLKVLQLRLLFLLAQERNEQPVPVFAMRQREKARDGPDAWIGDDFIAVDVEGKVDSRVSLKKMKRVLVPLEGKIQPVPHGAVCAVATREPWYEQGLLLVVSSFVFVHQRCRDGITGLHEALQANASFDVHAEGGEMLDQELLRVVLGNAQHSLVPRVDTTDGDARKALG